MLKEKQELFVSPNLIINMLFKLKPNLELLKWVSSTNQNWIRHNALQLCQVVIDLKLCHFSSKYCLNA